MFKDIYPVRWTGNRAVVTLPAHIDATNHGLVREQLLALIDRGPAELIADMTATVTCDHGGADALLRAYQLASVNGTRLRLAVSAEIVRRVLNANGLDRLVSIYPSVDAAIAAEAPANVVPLAPGPAGTRRRGEVRARRPQAAGTRSRAVSLALLLGVVDALADGVVLTDDDGRLVLANRRAEEMFGYARGEVIGRPVESLIPADLRAAHASLRAGYEQQPTERPMGGRARLVGLRKDGSTFPVRISLSPVPTATGRFIMAVIRDVTGSQPGADLAYLARAAAAADQARRGEELLDRIVGSLHHVGLSLQGAADMTHDEARQRIAEALQRLDDTIREIRDHVFGNRWSWPEVTSGPEHE